MSTPKIKSVEKLTITFIVDNTIEWYVSSPMYAGGGLIALVRMTKLPPGFIHEVPQHLSQPDVPRDDRTGVPFVDLENYCCG